jgi:hypothetical protein
MVGFRTFLRLAPVVICGVALTAAEMNVLTLARQRDICAETKAWFNPANFSTIDGMHLSTITPWLVLAAIHFFTRRKKSDAFDLWACFTLCLAAFCVWLNLQASATPVPVQQLCDGLFFREFNEAGRLAQLFLVIPYTALSALIAMILLIARFLRGRD